MTHAPKLIPVLSLTPPEDVSQKPTELITIRGHENLTLNARRAITILWHNAHRQGIEDGKEYVIELDSLVPTHHKGYEWVREAIRALMTTILEYDHDNGTTSQVQFLGGNNIARKDQPGGVLKYRFDPRLVDILKDSTIWGQIPLTELAAFGCKYTIPIFENLCQLTSLTYKTHHTYSLDEFRSMAGVEKDRYSAFGSLNKWVIKPAIGEINALAQFNAAIVPIKTARKVTHLRMSWWPKSAAEKKSAWSELTQPRTGRKAHNPNQAEMVFPPVPSADRRAWRAKCEPLVDDD